MSWLRVVGIIVIAAHGHDDPPIFALLFKRWTARILLVLSKRPSRFNELARAVPAARRMVVERLRELQDVALVERRVDPGPPTTITYSITTRGQQLIPHLERLWAVAEQQRVAVGPSPVRRDITGGKQRQHRSAALGRPVSADLCWKVSTTTPPGRPDRRGPRAQGAGPSRPETT